MVGEIESSQKELLKALYKGSGIEPLLELCGDCNEGYCFFAQVLHDAQGNVSREHYGLFDTKLCPHLQEVFFHTNLTHEQLSRRKLMSDCAFNLGLELGRRPIKDQVNATWEGKYESSFKQAYESGVRHLDDLRTKVFGKG